MITKDSIIAKVDTALNALSVDPITKGAVPAIGAYAVTYIDSLNSIVKTGTLYLGFIIAALTVYVKVRDIIRDYRKHE